MTDACVVCKRAELDAEIARLQVLYKDRGDLLEVWRAEIDRLQVQWVGMKSEVQRCHAEIERLRADVKSLEAALTTVRQLRALEARDEYR